MLDRICTGSERSLNALRGMTVHGGLLLEGMRLVHNRLELLLCHVADLDLLVVGADAA
jgi:hypothetical protein